jgi:hypothetical protein
MKNNPEGKITVRTRHAYIYKITNNAENKCYIGKTFKHFTLRWMEHFSGSSLCGKLVMALARSKITDWTFQVVEVVKFEYWNTSPTEFKELLTEKENNYILHYDSVDKGYNCHYPIKKTLQTCN